MTTDTPAAAPITAEREALAILASFVHEVLMGVYEDDEKKQIHDARRALERTGLLSLTDWDGNELASIGQVLTQPSGVDALWVERAMELAEELETAAILYGASEPESDEERDCRRRRLATREALRAHLSTALTGVVK